MTGRDKALIFDGTFDGLLTIIYNYYYEKINPSHIFEDGLFQQVLDAEYMTVVTDYKKASRVLEAIEQKISVSALDRAYQAFLSTEDERFIVVFRYLVLGFKVGYTVERYETEDYVRKVHKLSHYVYHEAHMLTGFARFKETRVGVFYAEVEPVNNVLPLLAEHFMDRFMNHRWVIHDRRRRLAAIYDGNNCMIAETPSELEGNYKIPDTTEAEDKYQELWAEFFKTIAIEDRINPKLQKQLMVRRFRKKASEFNHRK